MKLVYVISKHTNPNSDYKLHLPDPYNNKPICRSKRAFSIEVTEADKPTCKRCLEIYNDCKVYPLG